MNTTFLLFCFVIIMNSCCFTNGMVTFLEESSNPGTEALLFINEQEDIFHSLESFLAYFFRDLSRKEQILISKKFEDIAIRDHNPYYLSFAAMQWVGKDSFELAERLVQENEVDLLDLVIMQFNRNQFYELRGCDLGSREDLLVNAVQSASVKVDTLIHLVNYTLPLIGVPYDLEQFYDENDEIDMNALQDHWKNSFNDEPKWLKKTTQSELQYALNHCLFPEMAQTLVSMGAVVTTEFILNFPSFDLDPLALLNLKRTFFSLIDFPSYFDFSHIFGDDLLTELEEKRFSSSYDEDPYISLVKKTLLNYNFQKNQQDFDPSNLYFDLNEFLQF